MRRLEGPGFTYGAENENCRATRLVTSPPVDIRGVRSKDRHPHRHNAILVRNSSVLCMLLHVSTVV